MTEIGLLLPTRGLLLRSEHPDNAELVLALARRAETAGVDSLWVGDSLTAKPRLEPLTTLAAVAAVTERARLGTAVLLAALRHPVTTSHIVTSLDVLSRGRLTLGVGVGGAFVEPQKREWRTMGVEPVERARRLEEWVPLVRRLTRGETVTHHGQAFTLDEVAIRPEAVRAAGVPVLLATHWRTGSDRQKRRALALGDGIIGISDTADDFARLVAKLGELAAAEGRDLEGFDRAFYMTVHLDEDEAKAEENADAFIRAYYGLNFWKDKWGPFGHPDRVVERILDYVAAGARTVIVRFAAFEQERQLDRFLERVLPSVKPSP